MPHTDPGSRGSGGSLPVPGPKVKARDKLGQLPGQRALGVPQPSHSPASPRAPGRAEQAAPVPRPGPPVPAGRAAGVHRVACCTPCTCGLRLCVEDPSPQLPSPPRGLTASQVNRTVPRKGFVAGESKQTEKTHPQPWHEPAENRAVWADQGPLHRAQVLSAWHSLVTLARPPQFHHL